MTLKADQISTPSQTSDVVNSTTVNATTVNAVTVNASAGLVGPLEVGATGPRYAGSALSLTLNAGAGTGASGIVKGTLGSFRVEITAGTGSAPGDVITTVNFPASFATLPILHLTPANSKAQGVGWEILNAGVSGFDVAVTDAGPALTPGETYHWSGFVTSAGDEI